ncbi:MAG TPA: flagellar basal body P-ring formation chaperone FlgA [Vitreimonas sp.]|uniref:flagellar basal body P-ring formation chaperone FlgA n=1 Tax=Vitreimonas sp. TaxID=3069702 RepID=UPI002D5BF37E|nr:flagellar basal body P-ring formation chaperone FlgA [Vitreimonas sp.]HYD86938.1 flagellar basal body P-ring formation chaperone FlgA [Vitreimonas sp.]
MLRWFCLAACSYLLFAASFAQAQTVTLRPRVEANGPAVTMGDVFDGAPAEVAGRAIAPSPPAGQLRSISMPVLAAAASAAGLEFTPPPGVTSVQVVRPGGARATIPASGGRSVADAAVRRGESVTLVYEAPGMSLTMRARALEDGAVGQSVRLLNTSSNRTIDAVVTGPGAARANP